MVETKIKGGHVIMSVQAIIQSLINLLQIHEELIEISKQKTEIIKEGSTEKLQKIVITEYKQVQKLEQAELKRHEAVKKWFIETDNQKKEMTITQMLNVITDEAEKDRLGEITLQLTKAITELKRQEQLNEELLQQSLQFVQVSLNAINPTLQQMNYGNNQQTARTEISAFDSKA